MQWGAGNAETVDTGTGQTDAMPTPTETTGSVNAGADSSPSLFSFLRTQEPGWEVMTFPAFTVGKQGYLVTMTEGQVEGEAVEVFPVVAGPVISRAELIRQQEKTYEGDLLCWEALQDKHPELGPIIKLHKPERGECQGCDGGPDYSGDWPCRTIELIEEEY